MPGDIWIQRENLHIPWLHDYFSLELTCSNRSVSHGLSTLAALLHCLQLWTKWNGKECFMWNLSFALACIILDLIVAKFTTFWAVGELGKRTSIANARVLINEQDSSCHFLDLAFKDIDRQKIAIWEMLQDGFTDTGVGVLRCFCDSQIYLDSKQQIGVVSVWRTFGWVTESMNGLCIKTTIVKSSRTDQIDKSKWDVKIVNGRQFEDWI